MAQLLFYVEVIATDSDGRLVDCHLCSIGELPILYRNEKKANWRASLIRRRYIEMGYTWLGSEPMPPYKLHHDSVGGNVSIDVREVRVCT